MGDKTTITVREATLARFNQLKAELDAAQDAPDHSADSFLNGLLDTWEKVDEEGYEGSDFTATAEITPTLDEDALDGIAEDVNEVLGPSVADVKELREEIEKLQEITERVPEETAETFERRFR